MLGAESIFHFVVVNSVGEGGNRDVVVSEGIWEGCIWHGVGVGVEEEHVGLHVGGSCHYGCYWLGERYK